MPSEQFYSCKRMKVNFWCDDDDDSELISFISVEL
jgi:hypothetical protein